MVLAALIGVVSLIIGWVLGILTIFLAILGGDWNDGGEICKAEKQQRESG